MFSGMPAGAALRCGVARLIIWVEVCSLFYRDFGVRGIEMRETGDWGAVSASGEPATGGSPAPREAPPDDTVVFLAAPRPTTPLAGTAVYQPGALVAIGFLVPPAASALALAALVWGMGGAPIWLPLVLLLWIPVMLAGWFALGGVRLTREEIAFGRPLRAWRVIPLDAIERLECHGPRLTLVTTEGRRVSFTPALLRRGAQLRRSLLLSLPMQTLVGEARVEARRLVGDVTPAETGLEADTLTVRPLRWLLGLAFALTVALGLAAGVALAYAPWLALTTLALALLGLAALIWLAQEIFISDRGVIARFTLIRVTQSVSWNDLLTIQRAPGEIALVLRGSHTLICAGPRLLNERDGRRMREIISRYALARGTRIAPRAFH